MAATIDTEWIYAVVLSQLDDPWAEPEADELVEAIAKTLGFPGYTLGQIAIRTEGPVVPPIAFRAMAMTAEGGAAPPPPIEGGKNAVTVVVSGNVILGPAR